MDLFIDTNVLLNFFEYSSDDLEELNKLAVVLNAGRLRLLLPQQDCRMSSAATERRRLRMR